MTSGRAKLWRCGQAACAYLLTILWTASGLAKLIALPAFRAILQDHGVLCERAISLAWAVPMVEVLLGAATFVAFRTQRGQPLRRIVVTASVVLLAAFCAYVSRVREDVFQTVGCGCQGAFGLTDITGSPSRAAVITVNLVLMVLALGMWPFGPTTVRADGVRS
jgi:hypothetical protein